MQDELDLTKKRLEELSARAYAQGRYMSSEFLTLAEQDVLSRLRLPAPLTLHGGFDGAERRIALFGDAELCGYEADPPLCFVSVRPSAPKFADALSHRDFLGALMSLGVRRSVLGDIVVSGSAACIICLDSIAPFICEELTKVRHTSVVCAVADEMPELLVREPEETEINIASERLDAVVAAVYKLSRGESANLFAGKKVYVDGVMQENGGRDAQAGTIISVRGTGRFAYCGAVRETRKGRLVAVVKIYK